MAILAILVYVLIVYVAVVLINSTRTTHHIYRKCDATRRLVALARIRDELNERACDVFESGYEAYQWHEYEDAEECAHKSRRLWAKADRINMLLCHNGDCDDLVDYDIDCDNRKLGRKGMYEGRHDKSLHAEIWELEGGCHHSSAANDIQKIKVKGREHTRKARDLKRKGARAYKNNVREAFYDDLEASLC